MLYSNKTKDDILAKEELEKLREGNPEYFTLHHTLTRHDDNDHGEWDGLRGRITADMLKDCKFPEPSEETLICYCGPAGFNKTVEDTLAALGYSKDMLFKF